MIQEVNVQAICDGENGCNKEFNLEKLEIEYPDVVIE